MTKRPGIKRHQEVADQIVRMHGDLMALAVELSNAYPKKHPVVTSVVRTESALAQLRSALDDALCHEHPEVDPQGYYYGRNRL
jgi:hypothetical protein